jgi:cyclohexyl-isocyanide hydratase
MNSSHLRIGALLFDGLDQIDLTGPFEVLSRVPDSEYRIYAKTASPVRDVNGLRLTPLAWISKQAAQARWVFSVCTGALLLGAAGLLIGRRATTHWASWDLLPYFGATPRPPSTSGSLWTGT